MSGTITSMDHLRFGLSLTVLVTALLLGCQGSAYTIRRSDGKDGLVTLRGGMACKQVEALLGQALYEQPDKMAGAMRWVYIFEKRVYIVRFDHGKVHWVEESPHRSEGPDVAFQSPAHRCDGTLDPQSDLKNAASGLNLDDQVGKRVTLVGQAANAKIGAMLLLDEGGSVYLDAQAWPEDAYQDGKQKRMRVTGTLTVRHDLPVFVPEPGAPEIQGMPVEPGTNLKEASKRFVLTDFSYEWLR